MQDKSTFSLAEIIAKLGAEQTQDMLKSEFACSKNQDIEHFLHQNAVRFENVSATRTFLIFCHLTGELLAYFSLSFKSIALEVSKNRLKKLTGGLTNSNKLNVYLIAQLGKNTKIKNNSIRLNDILKALFFKLDQANRLVGGRVVILECENNNKLISHYEKHGFKLIETVDEQNLKTMFIIPDFQ